MTPLSDALVAAQTRALATLQKAYVAGAIDAEAFTLGAEACGIHNPVDMAHLLAALDVMREWGAALPAEPNGKPKPEPATDKQKAFIADLCQRANVPYPDDVRTKDEAHEIIESLQAGTYDAEKWRVPF